VKRSAWMALHNRRRGGCLGRTLLVVLVIVGVTGALAAQHAVRCALLKQDIVTLALVGADASGKRADAIYVLYLAPRTGRVAAVQLQRDTRVRFGGRTRKLNSVLGLGKERLLGLIGQLTGSKPDRYVLLTFDTATALCKALCPKGVTVDNPAAIDFRFSRSEGGYRLVVPKGRVCLPPRDFVMMARLRQATNDTSRKDGDNAARLPRQAMLMRALMRQVATNRDPRVLGRLHKVVTQELDTDLSSTELAALAWHFHRMRSANLRVQPAPGSPCRGGMWGLDKTGLAILTGELQAWALGKPRVDVVLQVPAGSHNLTAITETIHAVAPTAHVHTKELRQPIPMSWVAYASATTGDETTANRTVARELAVALHLNAPHRDQGSFGVTLAVGDDLIERSGDDDR